MYQEFWNLITELFPPEPPVSKQAGYEALQRIQAEREAKRLRRQAVYLIAQSNVRQGNLSTSRLLR